MTLLGLHVLFLHYFCGCSKSLQDAYTNFVGLPLFNLQQCSMYRDQSSPTYWYSLILFWSIHWSRVFMNMGIEHNLYSFVWIYIYFLQLSWLFVILWCKIINWILNHMFNILYLLFCFFIVHIRTTAIFFTITSSYFIMVIIKIKSCKLKYKVRYHEYIFCYAMFQLLKYYPIIFNTSYVREPNFKNVVFMQEYICSGFHTNISMDKKG